MHEWSIKALLSRVYLYHPFKSGNYIPPPLFAQIVLEYTPVVPQKLTFFFLNDIISLPMKCDNDSPSTPLTIENKAERASGSERVAIRSLVLYARIVFFAVGNVA